MHRLRNTGKAIFKEMKAKKFSRTKDESSDQQWISGYLQVIQHTHT